MKDWFYPLKDATLLPDELGVFGANRKHHTHEGIDLYGEQGEPVFAVEDGIVVGAERFTGEHCKIPSPWWNNTEALLIEGASGVVLYGEITILRPFIVMDKQIKAGDCIGYLETVLKKDKGRPKTMLHLELYKHGTRQSVEWEHDKVRPLNLLDPTVFVERAFYKKYKGDILDARYVEKK